MKKRRGSVQDHIRARDRIPDEVLKEIFPKKLKRYGASEKVYSQLKKMILRGKLKKGESLFYERIVQEFSVSRDVAHGVISQLKKDGLVISKRRVGSFIV
jgi:DNA-binding GntR family transcriptional regulator